MPAARIRLRDADPTALATDAATRLRRGELLVLPTETVYGLAVLPSHSDAVARARAWKGRAEQQPFTWHVAEARDLQRLAGTLPAGIVRLVDRYWPGPLTVIVPARDGGTCGVRLPAHDFTRAVIRAAGEPLWLSSVNRTGAPPLTDPEPIAAAVGDAVTLVVDDGPSPIGTASTIVRATGPRLEVLREGILTTADVLQTAARLVLFVCTGNTCRSPLAEALARDLTARTLGVAPADVLAHGYWFASAGVGAGPGMPASEGSLAAGAEIGLDLSAHESRSLTPELVQRAEQIFCLGRGHQRAILAEMPEAADKVKLLRVDGLDVQDPFGSDLRAYRRVRDEIRAAVGARLPGWLQR
ncbi:MAG: Sua5/YciO/YrdC/YwlC family protein [Planctomycetes bacterium]|nr:Sua5/YciO/YrdC/YwlC family protein [Planctomycetota bacterium]